MIDILKTKPPIKSDIKVSCGEIFGHLFSIRDRIHIIHLSTKSYSQHKALNDFYEGILDLTDSLIESYQGKYGLVKIVVPESKSGDPVSILKELASLTDNGKYYTCFSESWIKNQLDEISSLTYQTLYKLENLK